MSSIFRDASNFISSVLNAGTESFNSIESGLHTVNHYVSENSYGQDQQITINAKLSLSRFHDELEAEFEKNPQLKIQFDNVSANWRKTPEPA